MIKNPNNDKLYVPLEGMPEPKHGKVRDVYDLGDKVLFVASDRISAFDWVMPDPIPDKGRILTAVSEWWFRNTEHIIDNHLISTSSEELPDAARRHAAYLKDRSMLVRKAKTLPIEFIVRGCITGGGWKEYCDTGAICGNKLPEGLIKDSELPEPIFTPSTKAEEGHDENIGMDEYEGILRDFAKQQNVEINPFRLVDKSIELFEFGRDTLKKKGILLADTKFEFGLIESGDVILIDEALTPDSSRFWLDTKWKEGEKRYNYDKQILRDWLEETGWDKSSPPPELPEEIITQTRDKYIEAYRKITGKDFA
jgi:phosphoribosylaminoimidazole-succinocarboxamide synthase